MRSTTSFWSMKCMSRMQSDCSQKAEQQGRGDVVGQVADKAQALGRTREHRSKSGHRRCGSAESPRPAQLCGEGLDQVPVQLDCIQATGGPQQARGDGAAAGADLHQALFRLGSMTETMRRIVPGSWRKFWPKRLRGRWCIGASLGDFCQITYRLAGLSIFRLAWPKIVR